jgi:hypothetical protein
MWMELINIVTEDVKYLYNMSISNAIKTYIKEFYEVSYYPKEKQILLHDLPESQTRSNKIDIGRVGRVKITLMWGKIEEITGVQYHHKEFQTELSKFFVKFNHGKKIKRLSLD